MCRQSSDGYTVWVAGRVAVVQFPGTNCERETARALSACGELQAEIIWHAEPFPTDGSFAAVVLPGGFAYGDHLRAGAIARSRPS